MPIIKVPINIEKPEVFRYLGYNNEKGKTPPCFVEKQVDIAIREILMTAEPQINYDFFDFVTNAEDKKLIFKDGLCLSGNYIFKKLEKTEQIAAAILTLGSEPENQSADFFSRGDYLMGMIYDAVGSVALNDLKRSFFKKLCEKASITKRGLTRGFSPGSGGWSIEDQAIIFKLLDGKSIGVTLKDSMMMAPVKSLSIVYGIGEGLTMPDEEHDCSNCDLINCQFRLAPKQHEVTVCSGNRDTHMRVPHGEGLLTALIKHGFPLNNDCGGNHICGKCKVIVDPDGGTAMDETEKTLLTAKDISEGTRLACFIKVDSDMTVKIPGFAKNAAILTGEYSSHIIEGLLNPRVKKMDGKLCKPSLQDQRDDYTRLKQHLNIKNAHIPVSILKNISDVLRQSDCGISCTLRKDEIIDLRKYGANSGLYGIAADIGTTTIAAYLFDLRSGRRLGIYSSINPQKVFGADVISRINHTITHKNGLTKLQDLILDELGRIVGFFCQNNKIDPTDIFEITAVGNTVIMHLLLGIPCKNIANAPYIPAFTSKTETKASQLGININPEGYLITLPSVSGYIGADTVAAVLASGMAERDEISLLLDIGTNGEIVLGSRERLLACSTAAGPAFEGVGITFGMGGVDGAIDHADFGKTPIYTTIGGIRPIGICGSGIIDIVAELLRYKLIDTTGMLSKPNGKQNFMVDEESNIYITQRDIRQVQLAKAAIYAGIRVLAEHMQIDLDKIERVYLAGGFGNYINIKSAAMIGLIPHELIDRVKPIGNGAGTGAAMCLLSDDMMTKTGFIKERIQYIELSNSAAFSEEFINSMYF